MNPSLIITPNAKEAGKLFSIVPTDGSGDLTVTRATTATYVDSDGLIKTAGVNEVRFDYSNGSCPSILVQPQRTNLNLYSEDLNQTYWLKSDISIIDNNQVSPNGVSNSLGFKNNPSGFCRLTTPSFTFSANTDYTFSFFYKNIDGLFLSVVALSSISNSLGINLSTDETLSNGTFSFLDLKEYENGFKRISVKIRYTVNTSTSLYLRLGASFGAGSVDFNKSIYIWGAQLEVGSNATSYIPTTTSTVTRNADNIISTSNISSLVGLSEGSIYTEFMVNSATNFNSGILNLRDATANNRILLRFGLIPTTGGILNFIIRSNNTDVVNLSAGALVPQANQMYKVCVTYNQTEQKIFVNGALVATRAESFTPPTSITTAQIGGTISGSLISNINIFNSLVYTSSLTDAEAIQLTTL
jgi:hypothetical protein